MQIVKLNTSIRHICRLAFCLFPICCVVACGGLLDATIGGNVAGLSGGTTVTLLDNGTDSITVNSNGSFVFGTQIQAGSTYNVTVQTQPLGEICAVSNGTGKVSQNVGNVTGVAVNCDVVPSTNNYIFGTLNGLAAGASLTLIDSARDTLTLTSNGPFIFQTALSVGTTFVVTVSSLSSAQTCSITNGVGVISANATSNVSVICN